MYQRPVQMHVGYLSIQIDNFCKINWTREQENLKKNIQVTF